jgi:ankyrin repeat protein
MDASGYILFGLISLVFVLYAIHALSHRVKHREFSKSQLRNLAILAAVLALFGGRLYFVDANESLAIAAAEGDISQVRRLLARGASPNGYGPDGHAPALVYAAGNNNVEIVKVLLEKGADPKRRDFEGKTALDRARENRSIEVIKILEANGKPRN